MGSWGHGYEYFCGANVVLEIEQSPLLECAGISVRAMESKRPLYGYSSRFFDGVARGQVLVQGTFIVNFVHPDYVFRTIEYGLIEQGLTIDNLTANPGEIRPALNEQETAAVIRGWVDDPHDSASAGAIEDLRNKFWGTGQNIFEDFDYIVPNPHDSFGGLDLRITFGPRQKDFGPLGLIGYLISDVYITGRGHQIMIDEETIVEEFPFFGRNIESMRTPYTVQSRPAAASVEDKGANPSVMTLTPPGRDPSLEYNEVMTPEDFDF